jgi:hypothetical protein
MDNNTKTPKLLFQNLILVDDHEKVIKGLDLRNSILFLVTNFVHKNSNINMDGLRVLPW